MVSVMLYTCMFCVSLSIDLCFVCCVSDNFCELLVCVWMFIPYVFVCVCVCGRLSPHF